MSFEKCRGHFIDICLKNIWVFLRKEALIGSIEDNFSNEAVLLVDDVICIGRELLVLSK